MPIYEYRCPNCGTIETLQRITDPPLTRCPTCDAAVKKLISQSSFQLKGDGWYLTDYARKGRKDGKEERKEERKEGGAREESKASSADDKKSSQAVSKGETSTT